MVVSGPRAPPRSRCGQKLLTCAHCAGQALAMALALGKCGTQLGSSMAFIVGFPLLNGMERIQPGPGPSFELKR